jgi:MFS family permease
MTPADDGRDTQQSFNFLLLYASAVSGGAVAYVPFLTILLPLRVTELNADFAMNTLAYAAFLGAITASVSNIGFGWLSDITKTRKPWITAGMVGSAIFMALMPFAQNSVSLIAMILGWQVFLNMMLAPLNAWAGDCVPNSQKGRLGGFLAFGPAIGALTSTLITFQSGAQGNERYWMVSILAVALISPVLLFGRPIEIPHLRVDTSFLVNQNKPEIARQTGMVRMWFARLCVQIAEASLFAFLLMWFRSHDATFHENQAATVFASTLTLAIVATLIIGRWSDRNKRPILPLALCAVGAAIGLLIMASARTIPWAIAGYAVFGLMGGIFLSLHTSQTLRVLPSARFRGRGLGIFNLTNTVPSLVMPWLILALVPVYGFGALFFVLACFTLLAGGLLVSMLRLERP